VPSPSLWAGRSVFERKRDPKEVAYQGGFTKGKGSAPLFAEQVPLKGMVIAPGRRLRIREQELSPPKGGVKKRKERGEEKGFDSWEERKT